MGTQLDMFRDDASGEPDERPAITALAPWFGSKRTLAPVIVEEIGKHRAYFEPFCGGLSVLLNKPPCGHETANDLHGDLINLARVIQDETLGPQLYRRLRRVLLHEHVLSEAWEALENTLPESRLDRAYFYFVASWSGRNGFAGTTNVVGTKGIAVRWTPGGGHGGMRFESAVRSIPAWRRRLRRVTILNRDGFDVLAKIDDADGIGVYVDPPYLLKNGTYEHDFTDDNHVRLSKALGRFRKTRIVLSYYQHEVLSELYPKWTVRDCSRNKGLRNVGIRGHASAVAPEVLLINGPSYAGGVQK